MISFDKKEIKQALTDEDVFELLQDWGADPEFSEFGIICSTICHNEPGNGSRKLYYYNNSGLFRCYTECDSTFDIFELAIKVMDIQYGIIYDLNDAVRLVAGRFGIAGTYVEDGVAKLEDWEVFKKYDRLHDIELKNYNVTLKEYDSCILDRLNYSLKIEPWLNEGITQEVLNAAKIGYFPSTDQITIPHYDADGRFIGLRGRTVCKEDERAFGKYRPMKINNRLYNHPLGFALYGLNWSKAAIQTFKKVIIVEGEKSVLKSMSYTGIKNNICVACCGSSISNYQIALLEELGVEEIIIGFDKQFKEIGDDEWEHWTKKLLGISQKCSNKFTVSFMFDSENKLNYKDSPLDQGPDVFFYLFSNRIDMEGKRYN